MSQQLIHKMGGDSVVTNTESVLFSDGTEQFTAFIEPQGSTTLYVDNDRVNTGYTPDGTYLRPYPLIADAIARVIANGDNTQQKAYVIQISGGSYPETIDLSNTALNNLIFIGNDAVLVGNNTMSVPVLLALNNDNLERCLFYGIEFALNGSASHGVEITSTQSGTNLGKFGIIFTQCGFQDNTEDIYINNASFILFDNTGVTANMNITNVNQLQFVNSNGPNPQTPFVITTNTSAPTPQDWQGFSSASFVGVGIGSITTDTLSQVSIQSCIVSGVITDAQTENAFVIFNSAVIGNVTVNAGGILGIVNSLISQPTAPQTATVTVNGTLLSALSVITGTPIIVNSGGAFVEDGGVHDDGQLTVNSGGAYFGQGDMGLGSLSIFNHLNSQQEDLAGQLTINGGTSTSFTFSTTYTNAPIVVVTPTSDPTAIGGYWVTSTNTGFTINMKNSGTMAFSYHVIGAGS
jgi:hypothetical protein